MIAIFGPDLYYASHAIIFSNRKPLPLFPEEVFMKTRIPVFLSLMLLIACASHQMPSRYRSSLGSEILYSGGNGETKETAIIIRGAPRQSEGVEAEYYFLSKIFGEKDKVWQVHGQTMFREEKRVFDVIEIQLIPSQKKIIFYFDVSKLPWERNSPRQENE